MVPPGVILIIGGFLVPFLKGRVKSAFMLLLPVLAFIVLVRMPVGEYWRVGFLGYDLILGRVDRLSMVFGYIFTIISFIGILFALKLEDDLQHVFALMYAGGALGVTFAGDFFTLYIFWELLAVGSTFLILARRTRESQAAALRYIMVHVVGGLLLLAGIVIYVQERGTLEVGHIGLDGPGGWLIFLGIGLNAAIPPLHAWLQDAYPEATVTGAVFLSAFTTKSAVYLMARTFPGTELLIWVGALMAVIPVFYGVLENDVRRVLAYSIISQGGFMITGIGIGSQEAINGAVSHAISSILYTALLFMSAGSVLHMTGRIKCTDLGGLYKTMPLTALFYMVGAASISAFPLFSGFVSKSMVISEAAHHHLVFPWLLLMFASATTVFYAGLKVTVFTFFGRDSGIRTKEPPLNMLLAMGLTAFLCLFLGVYPKALYNILPYPVDYVPYTGAHVVGQLQVLMFGALAFCLLILSGYYPSELRAINLDVDWFYRKGARLFYDATDRGLNRINRACDELFVKDLTGWLARWSREPLSSLVRVYSRATGRAAGGQSGIYGAEARLEKNNLIPIGVPVILSILGLFCLYVLFVSSP